MLEGQMYREAERSWEREGESMANLRLFPFDVTFLFS